MKIVAYENQDQVYADLVSRRLAAMLQDAVQADYGFLKTPRGAAFAYAGINVEDKGTLSRDGALDSSQEIRDAQGNHRSGDSWNYQGRDLPEIEHRYFDIDVYGESLSTNCLIPFPIKMHP
nr:hypothetical protein [Paraburkholderia hospita]